MSTEHIENMEKPANTLENTSQRTALRQPLSTLGKIAFWTFLSGSILMGALVIVLAVFAGGPSQDSVIGLVCWLACTVLIVSGVRWLQALGVLVGAYLMYLVFTEPFVLESLANPKGPNGGYGHFVGDVVVCSLFLVAFLASIGVTLQNYRPRTGRQTPRWFRTGLNVVAGMALGALFVGALAQPAAPAGLTYTNGVPTIHMDAGSFVQSTVLLSKGSSLILTDDSSSEHILANGTWNHNQAQLTREPGAPLVSNKKVSSSSVEVGPFTVAGTYHILCLVHPGMTLTIIVQ